MVELLLFLYVGLRAFGVQAVHMQDVSLMIFRILHAYLRHPPDIPKIALRHPQIPLRYPPDTPPISQDLQRFAKDFPKKPQIFPQDFLMISP